MMSRLSSVFSSTWQALPTSAPSDVCSAEWIARMRTRRIETAIDPIEYAERFVIGVNAGWPAEDVHAEFVTACTVIESSLHRLKQAGLVNDMTVDTAAKMMSEMLGRKIQVRDATVILQDGVDRASMVNEYQAFAVSAAEKLRWLADFIKQTAETGLGLQSASITPDPVEDHGPTF